MESAEVESFPPIVREDARVLVLGSMPSIASLRAHQYYGNPQNLFWTIMGGLFGAGPKLPYAARVERIAARGVALWDVARRCRRRRSADATMRDVEPNDIQGLKSRGRYTVRADIHDHTTVCA